MAGPRTASLVRRDHITVESAQAKSIVEILWRLIIRPVCMPVSRLLVSTLR